MAKLKKQLKRIHKILKKEAKEGRGVREHIGSAAEELGEFVAAHRIETGYKDKPLPEPAKNEAIDLIICGLALFYGSEGTVKEIPTIMKRKLSKWEKNLKMRKKVVIPRPKLSSKS